MSYGFSRISSVLACGAKLQKTGQTTSYRNGDDGFYEEGRATSFFVLGSNNPFGNTTRFTDELGGQTYTNNIVIDWSTYDGSTVLGYSKNIFLTVNLIWDSANDFPLTYSTGGFSGWRLWNKKEAENMYNGGGNSHFWFAPWNNAIALQFWTSTTPNSSTTTAFVLSSSYGQMTAALKAGASGRAFPVRTFTVTGTTLT